MPIIVVGNGWRHQYIAWYYAPEMDDEGFELDQIDYDEPDDLQDIGY